MSDPPRLWMMDANVILRLLLQDNPDLSPKADAIWDAVDEGRTMVRWDPVTLTEVVYVLTSRYRLPRERISEALLPLLLMPNVVIPGKDRYVHALRLFASEVPHFGDACLCAAALEASEGRILSFDRKLPRAPGIRRAEDLSGE